MYLLQLSDFVSVIDPEDLPGVGGYVGNVGFDPGPGEPLLQSGNSLNMPNFAGDVDILQVPDSSVCRDYWPRKCACAEFCDVIIMTSRGCYVTSRGCSVTSRGR